MQLAYNDLLSGGETVRLNYLLARRLKMWLLIDDVRDLNCEVTAKTPEAGKKMLVVGGWECLCLDHDLGTEESGYDIAVWALENGFMPKKVQLVTINPVGKKNIANALKCAGYKTTNGTVFEC